MIESEHRGTTLVELYVAPGELGRVIGKQGRTAAALRTLASAAGEKEGKTVTLEIRDGQAVNWDEMAVVGRVARPHGIRGQVIVNPETDFPEDRFSVGSTVFVNRGGRVEPLVVTASRIQQGRPVIGIDGIADMDAARGTGGTRSSRSCRVARAVAGGQVLPPRLDRVRGGDGGRTAGRHGRPTWKARRATAGSSCRPSAARC